MLHRSFHKTSLSMGENTNLKRVVSGFCAFLFLFLVCLVGQGFFSSALAQGSVKGQSSTPAKEKTRQTVSAPKAGPSASKATSHPKDKSDMVVDAREMVYDRDKDQVIALGDAQIYYQGRVLEADRVTYDRKTNRLYAEGRVKITDADGTISYGDRVDLSRDFRDGFIDSFSVITPTNSRFSSPRAERRQGEDVVFEHGTYTGCEPCKEDPTKPPLWQVKAVRIIHNNAEHRIYYENATFEFMGYPVAWFPFFSSPDPSVKRQSGFMMPRYISKTSLGQGVSMPYYWAAAPNYDVLFTPTMFSRQGLHLDVLWRHRLENGYYRVRSSGIYQADPSAFPKDSWLGAGNREFRGAISSRGRFDLNDKWKLGWDGAIATDKFYFANYKTTAFSAENSYLGEITSKLYLHGQGERSWADLSAHHFLGISTSDWQRQMGSITPSFDYERRFTPESIEGELKFRANSVYIQRDAAIYQPLPFKGGDLLPTQMLYSSKEGTYYGCRYMKDGAATGSYAPGHCLLRGFAGDYFRTSLDFSWRRQFIDPIGQVWTPFVGLRGDVASVHLRTTGYNAPNDSFNGAGYSNAHQTNFINGTSDNTTITRLMPSVGFEYRYPFFATFSSGIHTIEPIVQTIIRPNEQKIGKLPNEDAQSLIFDENSIFALNKFSGYDRIEGGSRVNYGGRYSFAGTNGVFATLLFAQSAQIAGRNSFSQNDLANTGFDSGLESKSSDYVAAANIQPSTTTNFAVRTRLDNKTGAIKRLDVEGSTIIASRLHLSALYTRVAPQPEIGYGLKREGVVLRSHLQLPRNFYVGGSILFDLDRYLSKNITKPSLKERWGVNTTSLSMGYKDECLDWSVAYSRVNNDYSSGVNQRTSIYLMRINLKDIGEYTYTKKEVR